MTREPLGSANVASFTVIPKPFYRQVRKDSPHAFIWFVLETNRCQNAWGTWRELGPCGPKPERVGQEYFPVMISLQRNGVTNNYQTGSLTLL